MKKLLPIAAGIIVIMMLGSCKTKQVAEQKPVMLLNQMDTISYIIGADVSRNLEANGIAVNAELFAQGFKDRLNNIDTIFTQEEIQEILMAFQNELQNKQQEQMNQESAENKVKGQKFLEENKKNKDVIVTNTGLQYKVITMGTGNKPQATSNVTVHYEGKLIDGTIFDSSYQRGETISFKLNQVIPGWTEALQLMPTGSIYELYIPSDLGYGDRSIPGIPAGSVLIFKVELFSFE
jgi:FKBP-type peptidyl-prolyl cis-trans isomerase FklB